MKGIQLRLSRRASDWAFLILFGIGWGCTIPLSKIMVSTGYQPSGLIFWQLVISIAILAIPSLIQRLPMPISPRHLAYYAGIAVIGTLLPNSFSYLAFAQLPAGIVAIVIATVPMFALLIALAFRLEHFQWRRFVGIGLGVAALMLIAIPDASLPDPAKAIFVFAAMVAAISYGFEGSYITLFDPRDTNPITALLAASILGAIVVLPVAVWRGEFISLSANFTHVEMAIIASAFFHAVTYAGYIWLVGRAGPVFTSQIAYFVTLWAVLMSWLFLGENYAWTIWIALALMVAGLRLVQPRMEDET